MAAWLKNKFLNFCEVYGSKISNWAWHKRWNKIRQQYGIDKDEWYWMLKEQNYQCRICKTELKEREREKGRRKKSEICVDHDHKTMRVRGLLCVQCNFLIGHAKEDVSILNSAIIYVKELCTNPK